MRRGLGPCKLVALVALGLVVAACGDGAGGKDGPGTSPNGEPGLDDDIPSVARSWGTDWSKRTISLSELIAGIPRDDPRDVIPPIDEPALETVDEASQWLVEREPVVLLEQGGEARAYPLRIMTWHEIVNDQVSGAPVAITYCPLCNSAVTFRRQVNGQVLRFGTSGLLRNSDLVMWDRQTESLWQQITGEAIVGELVGTRLEFLPAPIVSWRDFKARFPQGSVLSRQTGFERAYGSNPYEGYDSSSRPFLFQGEPDDRYPAMERVVGLRMDGEAKAYPFSVIAREGAVNDTVAGVAVVVFWGAQDTASALDDPSIPQGRDVGVGVAYERTVDGRVLTFEASGDKTFVDRETGSSWDLLGQATSGPLAGKTLRPAVHTNELWFAWAAFNEDSPVYTGAATGR